LISNTDAVPREAVEAWHQELSKNQICIPFSNKIGTLESVEAIKLYLEKFEVVGVIGMPNSGKHNLLNALRSLGNLIKYPGLAFKKTAVEAESLNVLLMNYSNSSRVPEPSRVVESLLDRMDLKKWTSHYGLPAVAGNTDFIMQQARAMKFVRKVL
jgi:ABC-type uncharacterized transport system ATPase subunit